MPPKKSQPKKKKATGPVRGFATTSVPKKALEPEQLAADAPAAEAAAVDPATASAVKGAAGVEGPGEEAGVNGAVGGGSSGAAVVAVAGGEWDGEDDEKHQLQLLADKIRSSCDKEVSRMSKVIDYERRMAKTYPNYAWTDRDLPQRILALALAADEDAGGPLPAYEPEDKVVAKVATLYGILEQVGFTAERIEECLRTVKTLELEDALDWLFLHCEPEELNCEGPIVAPPTFTEAPPTPRADAGSNGFSSLTTPSPARTRTASSRNSPPLGPDANGNGKSDDASAEAALRARILAYDDELSRDLAVEPGEEANANAQYATLKLQLSEIQRAQGAQKRAQKGRKPGPAVSQQDEDWQDAQAELLKKKIKTIEGDYTFRKVDAEKLYREERVKLDASQLADRLAGASVDPADQAEPAASEQPSTGATSPRADEATAAAAESSSTDGTNGEPASAEAAAAKVENGAKPASLFTMVNDKPPAAATTAEDEESSLFGNMLDEPVVSETTEAGETIYVRDMALPKHYSGKTPKANLEETVRKVDKYATVVFSLISRSRAARAEVEIRWDGGRTQRWDMLDVACGDKAQAFNYIATVALFAISTTPVNKQLPPIFRDLWDELVVRRKEEHDELYRERLKLFKQIAEPRIQPPPSRAERTRTVTAAAAEAATFTKAPLSDEASQRIADALAERQSWPSYQEMLKQRSNLPIAAYRSLITSTIEESQCIVLCGETGCGKSTQVPSFILEHGMRKGRDVKIYCTEPRRISAISLAQRVSSELGEGPNACGTRNSLVGYSIRLDSMVSPSSRIIYATTGIVLRMLEGAESLADCTHIIIDEVHERSIDSDFLLIILRSIIEMRKDLKVILMSATVDADKIASYMGGCPVIQVPGRTFPVSSHFLEDVVELTNYKLDPHSTSPYVAKSKRIYGGQSSKAKKQQQQQDDAPLDDDDDDPAEPSIAKSSEVSYSRQTLTTLDCIDHHAINYDLITLLLENLCFHRQELVPFSAAILIFLPSLESIRRLTDTLESHPLFGTREFLVLPLHSTISNENQGLVFNVPRPGVRKIVISTNLAETGVTIPDITAVIDTGKHREMRFDEKRQISRLVETFVAQSNAAQRRGRAGRVREGICFHLFTKQRHDTLMAEHPQPEMLRLSLQDLALRIKIMKIGNSSIEDVLLKALDPPLAVNIQRAVSALIEAKALTPTEEITSLGRHLAKLPMDVHLGKFLIMATLFGCLDAALTITAALNSKSPWVTPFGKEHEADTVKRGFKVECSDFLTTYNAYCSWRTASGNGYEREFTRKSFLSQQNLQMMEELRQQYFSFLVDAGFIDITDKEKRELVSTKVGKSRTRFVKVPDALDEFSKDGKVVMGILAASMYPKLLLVEAQSGQMKTLANNAPAAIHPSSVNFAPGRRIDFGGAKFVVYNSAMHTKKLYVWDSGPVDDRAVYLLCGNADFQLAAHSLAVDRKIRTSLEPKTALALKLLRKQFDRLFNQKMKNPLAELSPHAKEWLALVVESLATSGGAVLEKKVEKKKEDEAEKEKVTLSLHRFKAQ